MITAKVVRACVEVTWDDGSTSVMEFRAADDVPVKADLSIHAEPVELEPEDGFRRFARGRAFGEASLSGLASWVNAPGEEAP